MKKINLAFGNSSCINIKCFTMSGSLAHILGAFNPRLVIILLIKPANDRWIKFLSIPDSFSISNIFSYLFSQFSTKSTKVGITFVSGPHLMFWWTSKMALFNSQIIRIF